MSKLVYEQRMSDQDALMWRIEKDPLLRSTILGVTILRGAAPPPTRDILPVQHRPA